MKIFQNLLENTSVSTSSPGFFRFPIHALTQDNESVRLRHLNLDDCTIGDSEDDAVQPLPEALAKCPQLRYLNLRSGGLEILVGGLQASGAQLTHLDLGKFPCQECVNSIFSFSHASYLHIAFSESNGEFGSEGARVLADFLYTQATSIQYLNVESNELGDEGVCILMEPFAASKNCLEELNLNMNEIEAKGAETLVRATLPKLKVNHHHHHHQPSRKMRQSGAKPSPILPNRNHARLRRKMMVTW